MDVLIVSCDCIVSVGSCDLEAKIIQLIWGQISAEETQHGGLRCHKVRTDNTAILLTVLLLLYIATELQLYYTWTTIEL